MGHSFSSAHFNIITVQVISDHMRHDTSQTPTSNVVYLFPFNVTFGNNVAHQVHVTSQGYSIGNSAYRVRIVQNMDMH